MTLLATALAKGREALKESLSENILKTAFSELALPETITGEVIGKYVRKAMRTGVWRTLPREAKALLLVASKVIKTVKSHVLYEILRELLIRIELSTLKGKALYYGLIILARKLGSITKALKEGYLALLYTGISYLNNPPMFKIL